VKPAEYFSPSAQIISRNPASSSANQAIRIDRSWLCYRGLARVRVAPVKVGRIHNRSSAKCFHRPLLPERLGLIEARVRLAGAIEQLRDLRLLIAHDEARGKRAVAVLFFGQAAPRPGQDIRA